MELFVFQEVSGQAKVVDPALAGLDTPVQPFPVCLFQSFLAGSLTRRQNLHGFSKITHKQINEEPRLWRGSL